MNERAKDYQSQGIALMGQSQFSEARKAFQKALEMEECSELYMDLGNACASEANYQDAVDAFSKALIYEPDNGEIYYCIGSVYLLQQRLKKCIESYNKAESLGFNNVRLYMNLASIYNAMGDRQMELRNYTKAIDKNPLIGDLYVKKAMLLIEIGKVEAALETTEELRKLFPDAFEGYDLTARAYMAKGLSSKALEILDEGIAKFFNDANLRLSKAGLLTGMGKADEAEAVIEDLKSRPNADFYKRAILLQESSIASLRNDPTKMKQLLLDVVGLEKEGECDEQARFMLMMTANVLGDLELALEQADILDALDSASTFSISGLYYKGESLEKIGKIEDAVAQYKKAAKKLRVLSVNNRTNYEVYIFRAMAHRHLKEYEKAIEMAEFITNLQPNRPDGYVILADIYKDMGDEEKSNEQLSIAKEKNPDLKGR